MATAQSAQSISGGQGAGHSLSIDQARQLIHKVNADNDLQSHFGHIDPPKPVHLEWLANFFKALADLFAPIGPILPYLLYALAIAVVIIVLIPVARLLINTRFERFRDRDRLNADAPWRPTREAVAALLGDIDALAADGRYDEAVHLLLVRSVADINAYRPDMVRLHYSARDILIHPLLPAGARPAFQRIVGWVEKSYFAGIAVGKAGFDACRQAYVDFVAAEGIA